jgi:hypothetical protein
MYQFTCDFLKIFCFGYRLSEVLKIHVIISDDSLVCRGVNRVAKPPLPPMGTKILKRFQPPPPREKKMQLPSP